MQNIITLKILILISSLSWFACAQAALINQYNFDLAVDPLKDSAGSTNLLTNGDSSPDFTGGSYYSDGNSNNYLYAAGPGALPDWTASVWVYTSNPAQGDSINFRGVLSNDSGSATADSWQVSLSDGEYRLYATNGSLVEVIGDVMTNSWQNIVVQQAAGSTTEIYLNGNLVGDIAAIGGLNDYRIGINRNSNRSFEGFIDNVQFYDDSDVSAADIFAAGPGINAVPSVIAGNSHLGGLLLLLLFGYALRRTAGAHPHL